jgi:hypothetical protein
MHDIANPEARNSRSRKAVEAPSLWRSPAKWWAKQLDSVPADAVLNTVLLPGGKTSTLAPGVYWRTRLLAFFIPLPGQLGRGVGTRSWLAAHPGSRVAGSRRACRYRRFGL